MFLLTEKLNYKLVQEKNIFLKYTDEHQLYVTKKMTLHLTWLLVQDKIIKSANGSYCHDPAKSIDYSEPFWIQKVSTQTEEPKLETQGKRACLLHRGYTFWETQKRLIMGFIASTHFHDLTDIRKLHKLCWWLYPRSHRAINETLWSGHARNRNVTNNFINNWHCWSLQKKSYLFRRLQYS